jgi:hypothetical protein
MAGRAKSGRGPALLHEGVIVRRGVDQNRAGDQKATSQAIKAALTETTATARVNDDAKSSPVEDHDCLGFRRKYLLDGIAGLIDKGGVHMRRQGDGPRFRARDRSPLKAG